jgi:hypothetical protein
MVNLREDRPHHPWFGRYLWWKIQRLTLRCRLRYAPPKCRAFYGGELKFD